MTSYSLLIVLSIILSIVYIIPLFFIMKKAGFSPFWALIALVPFINILAYWIFAFIKWPVEKVQTHADS